MVRDFYRQVAMDDLLGARVRRRARRLVGAHPQAGGLLGLAAARPAGYEGNPLRAHAPVHAHTPFGPELYERWLDLFEATVDAGYAGPVAEVAKGRARRMAGALRRLLDGVHGPGSASLEPIFGATRSRAG